MLWIGWLVNAQGAAPDRAITPPSPAREFRGAWVATVKNIDWPSRPGLTADQQKAELTAMLDQAARLKLNAILLQVRPACDALYASRFEPWSPYLTGRMGKPPEPYYDPLEFAVTQAHRRGLELHAWFNPYRALVKSPDLEVAPTHVSRKRPELVRDYGKYLWLDPGDPAVQDYSISVVLDVVRRYDVDGVHFDDYFYPYPEKGSDGTEMDFPDEPTWKKYGLRSGLSRDDWRRQNVNGFIQRLYRSIKAAKPWVKFGISPFGIWRPGHPPQI
ncbi:MAG: family 10 glycosylhydrolase, partial [Verrucomicrobiales bacterium]|nr:family 10 glycosylhydrolase [Verrucomicrobiales bacterium]